MQELKIDYSEIAQSLPVNAQEEWEPPVHKYFGKKLPNGKTEKEPVYVFKAFPSMMYGLRDGKIVARVVNNQEEKDALPANWTDTPAAFGYIGAPSFEQHIAMKEAAAAEKGEKLPDEQEVTVGDAPRRGRPPKA